MRRKKELKEEEEDEARGTREELDDEEDVRFRVGDFSSIFIGDNEKLIGLLLLLFGFLMTIFFQKLSSRVRLHLLIFLFPIISVYRCRRR